MILHLYGEDISGTDAVDGILWADIEGHVLKYAAYNVVKKDSDGYSLGTLVFAASSMAKRYDDVYCESQEQIDSLLRWFDHFEVETPPFALLDKLPTQLADQVKATIAEFKVIA